jgi:hypothetical protein
VTRGEGARNCQVSVERQDAAMKTTRTAKGERRAHRKARDRRRLEHGMPVRAIDGALDPRLLERIVAAAQRFDVSAPWGQMAPQILPVLKRVHHPFPSEAAPIQVQVPPGIWTGFGIDLGPAFSHVTAAMADRWGVDPATLLGASLDNLRRLVADEPPRVQRFDYEGAQLIGVQGQGWGSSLLLLPDLLGAILGPTPRTLLAPVRNTLIAMPDDVEADLAIDVWHALADGAHDELAVDPLRWNGTAVVAIGDRSVGLPN